jgi:hypothetical protein
VLGVALGSAALAALTVHFAGLLVGHLLGYVLGRPLFALAGYFVLYRRGGPVYRLLKLIFIAEP